MSNVRVIAMTDFGANRVGSSSCIQMRKDEFSNIISTECWNNGAWRSGIFRVWSRAVPSQVSGFAQGGNVRARRSKEVFHVEHPKTLIRRVGVEPGFLQQEYGRSRLEAFLRREDVERRETQVDADETSSLDIRHVAHWHSRDRPELGLGMFHMEHRRADSEVRIGWLQNPLAVGPRLDELA